MAVYTTRDAISDLMGEDLSHALADHDDDTRTDAGLAQAITLASAEVDARLAKRYVVPFADVGDDPPTPTIVQQICLWFVASRLYLKVSAGSEDHEHYRKLAENLCNAIVSDDESVGVPGATEVSGTAAADGADYDACSGPAFAGCDGSGRDNMADW